MSPRFAARVDRIEPSATVAVGNRARSLKAEGVDVVDLSVGEPDFRTPDNVVMAAERALEAGEHGYTPSKGIPELREAISGAFAADGLDYGPDDVIVTPGAKQALFEAVMALVDDGDEVVLLDPAWVSYEAIVKLAGGRLSRVDLVPHEFRLEPALDDLAEAVSSATQLLLVNSPSNPSGAVFSDAALEGVRDLAVDHDVVVLSDEIYKEIVYGVAYTSLGSLDGMAERTVTVNGFSKAYAMTGWRLGYLGGPPEIVAQAAKVHSHSVTCASNPVQHAGVEALTNCADAVAEMVAAFGERRDLVVDLLANRGLEIPVPEGAFYAMVPVDEDDTTWCQRAIDEAHVAMVPSTAFGTPGYARLSYANSQERIREGIERLDGSGLL